MCIQIVCEAVAFPYIVLTITSKNHVTDSQYCYLRGVLDAKHRVLFEPTQLGWIGTLFHLIKRCHQETAGSASGVIEVAPEI